MRPVIHSSPQRIVDEARELGKARYNKAREDRTTHTNFFGGPPSVSGDCYGAFAELCFEMVSGLPILTRVGKPTYRLDFCGWEIKHTRNIQGRLIVPSRDKNRYQPEDRIMLIFVDPPRFSIIGWQHAGFFVGVPDRLDAKLKWPGYWCRQHEMFPYEEDAR